MKTTDSAIDLVDHVWVEGLDAELPLELINSASGGCLPASLEGIRLHLRVRKWPDGPECSIRSQLKDTLLDVLLEGAKQIGNQVLPPSSKEPLDLLRCKERDGDVWGEPIVELQTPLWLALVKGCSRRFAIEFRRSVKINAKWGVAPDPEMTPRQLETLFGFDPTQYSLYRPQSATPLSPDVPLELKRGDCFEAQKDGKYGFEPRIPPKGLQAIDSDVAAVVAAGLEARIVKSDGQEYVEVRGLGIPAPPWSCDAATILIAIPETYPRGGLDAFYLEDQVTQKNGSVPYQQEVETIDGRSWRLISWHYADDKPWHPNHDDLASHIAHCRGFFLTRGVQ